MQKFSEWDTKCATDHYDCILIILEFESFILQICTTTFYLYKHVDAK